MVTSQHKLPNIPTGGINRETGTNITGRNGYVQNDGLAMHTRMGSAGFVQFGGRLCWADVVRIENGVYTTDVLSIT